MKKILILKPAYTAQGGISNYYKVLENKFSLPVEYFERGARNWPHREGSLTELLRALKDLIRFIVKLFSFKYDTVLTNTSLGSFAVIRDGLFVLFAKLLNCKAVVFFRGLDENFQELIEKKFVKIFKLFFFSADSMIVLSSTFKKKLVDWGYRKDIFIETTIVDEDLIKDVDELSISKKYSNIEDIRILFLARVEKTKGIYEAVKTYSLLKEDYPNLILSIAGDGFELKPIKEYVATHRIKGVEFLGQVSGQLKIEAFRKSHIYFFPSYSEGMPNSVLEAMAFGLPVIARPVGGLIDILKDKETGFNTDSLEPEEFRKLFIKLMRDNDLLMKIAINNYKIAISKFTVINVIERLENIFNKIRK